MINIANRTKKNLIESLKKYTAIISNLGSNPKATEEDTRIVINDLLHDVLGYDKYEELKTEFRQKQDRIDYAVALKTSNGKKRKREVDFFIEAKASSVELGQKHVDQTQSYCLQHNVPYFFLTNAIEWRLYKVEKARKNEKPSSKLIAEMNFNETSNLESQAESFYFFSKECYAKDEWEKLSEFQSATTVEDVAAVLLSDKVIKVITKELNQLSDMSIRIKEDYVKDLVRQTVVQQTVSTVNESLLKRLNKSEKRPSKKSKVAKEERSEMPRKDEATSIENVLELLQVEKVS